MPHKLEKKGLTEHEIMCNFDRSYSYRQIKIYRTKSHRKRDWFYFADRHHIRAKTLKKLCLLIDDMIDPNSIKLIKSLN